MPKKKTTIGECVYCGQTAKLGVDHVPPQCLFSKLPEDVVEVPSCWKCNNRFSLDDEYFKTMLVLKDKSGSHPEAALLRDSVFRGLENPKKRKFKEHLIGSFRKVALRSPSGLYLGRTITYYPNDVRLDRFVARITRGLFWYHHKRRLPPDFEVSVRSEYRLRELDPTALEKVQTEIVQFVFRNPVHSIGTVLKYRFALCGDLEDASAWLLEFYDDVKFLAVIAPPRLESGHTVPEPAGRRS